MTEGIRLKKTASRNDRRAALLLQGLFCFVVVVSSLVSFSFAQIFPCQKTASVTLATTQPNAPLATDPFRSPLFNQANDTSEGLSTGDILKIVGLAFGAVTFLLGGIIGIPSIRGTIKKRKKNYSTVWKKSSKFEPTEILGSERGTHSGGFRTFYRGRTEDGLLQKGFEAAVSSETSKRHLLVIGSPLAGKSRMVYEWLSQLKPPADILIPHYSAVELESFFIPKRLKPTFRRPKVLLLDDLQRYVEFPHFAYLLSQFSSRKDITIIATCRSGGDYKKVTTKLLADQNIDLENLFSTIEIKPITRELARAVAEKVDIPWVEVEFNKTIGSVFLKLKEMRRRFEEDCTAEERAVLGALKWLFLGGFVVGRLSFPQHWVKLLSQEKFELEKKAFEWHSLFSRLEALEFLRLVEEQLSIEEVYLEEIIEPSFRISLADFEELKTIFQAEPEALLLLGGRLFTIGEVVLEKAKFMKTAIEAYLSAQQSFTRDTDYARTQGSIGNAYCRLAEVEDKAKNCRKGIEAYEKALQVYTFARFPIQYATAQSNLGAVYVLLAEVEEKQKNCQRAIKAFREALRVRTFERFPMQYALTQNNLGNAYQTLAEVEEKQKNCQRAIKAFREALRVYTFERSPIHYALTQHNLGTAYETLAEVGDTVANCQKAIAAYQEALRVRTFERFPMHYAATQNNLGVAYVRLATVEEKKENCQRAIKAFREALRVRTFERFPMQYALTQNNLGNAYQTLAEVEEKQKNCQRAIKAFREALRVYTFERSPMDYAMTQNNLGTAYERLAAVEDMATNCKQAITAFREALRVYTFEHFPMHYAATQNNLGATYQRLAEVEDKATNCQQAIAALKEALKIYSLEHFPMDYAGTSYNLGRAYRDLAEVEEQATNCRKAIKAFQEALKGFTKEYITSWQLIVMQALGETKAFCAEALQEEAEEAGQ